MPTIKTKIQIFNDSNSAFGPGKAQLLLAIAEHGSISVASKSMNMSYKRAWDLVNAMNESFLEPLVATKVGGSHGGGAEVTSFGIQVLSLYQEGFKESEAFVQSQMSSLIKLLR